MRRLLIAALAGCALVSCGPVAAETKLLSGFLSHHLDGGDWNERNHGLGIQHGPVAVGFYKNSLGRTSTYAAYEYRVERGKVFYGVVAGAATGYHSPVVPFVLPEVGVRIGQAEIALLAQPVRSTRHGAVPFLAVQLRVGF